MTCVLVDLRDREIALEEPRDIWWIIYWRGPCMNIFAAGYASHKHMLVIPWVCLDMHTSQYFKKAASKQMSEQGNEPTKRWLNSFSQIRMDAWKSLGSWVKIVVIPTNPQNLGSYNDLTVLPHWKWWSIRNIILFMALIQATIFNDLMIRVRPENWLLHGIENSHFELGGEWIITIYPDSIQ